jgi:hypothetical protein
MRLRLPAAWIGLLVFAAVLAAVELFAAHRPPLLAIRMILAAAAGLIVFRAIPWRRVAGWSLQRRGFRNLTLYFLFLSHFLRIFLEECFALFRAWRLAAPRKWRAGWWRSIHCATASIFPRVLCRAERFYAALLVKGLAQ